MRDPGCATFWYNTLCHATVRPAVSEGGVWDLPDPTSLLVYPTLNFIVTHNRKTGLAGLDAEAGEWLVAFFVVNFLYWSDLSLRIYGFGAIFSLCHTHLSYVLSAHSPPEVVLWVCAFKSQLSEAEPTMVLHNIVHHLHSTNMRLACGPVTIAGRCE